MYLNDQYRGTLHEKTKELIQQHLDATGGRLDCMAGLPGFHAEARAVNDAFNQLTDAGATLDASVLKQIQASTYKLGPPDPPEDREPQTNERGGPFEARTNCTGILQQNNILTGITHH